MLTVASCMKALEPLKIIPSKDGGPYEYQTKIGLCILGPIQNAEHQNSLKCNRVAVKDTSTGKLAKHSFLIENAGKYMSIEQMFEQMYYNNFNEKGIQIGKLDGNIERPMFSQYFQNLTDISFIKYCRAYSRHWGHGRIFFTGIFSIKRAFCLLAPPKQVSFLPF